VASLLPSLQREFDWLTFVMVVSGAGGGGAGGEGGGGAGGVGPETFSVLLMALARDSEFVAVT
jgi:hypothetical protein